MPTLRAAALSDIGRVRRENEDRPLCDEAALLFGVADGVGGLPGGGEAAQLAIEEFARALRASPPDQPPDLLGAALRAHEAVRRLGGEIGPASGIGTTLTAGCLHGGALRIAHIGDSRCYASRGRDFTRLTEDHSVENEARLRRARGEIVYYHEGNRNALTRCLGQPGPLEPDVIERLLQPGDRYLFCTDGITRLMPDPELGALLQKAATPRDAVSAAVQLALLRGGPDNATAVAVFVDSL